MSGKLFFQIVILIIIAAVALSAAKMGMHCINWKMCVKDGKTVSAPRAGARR